MKRGQAHVEVIISFVIFITVITFLLIYIQPQKSTVLETSLIEDVQKSFVDAAQTNVTIALINKSGTPCKPDLDLFDGNAISVGLKTGYYYIYVSPNINNVLLACNSSDIFFVGNVQQEKILSEVLLHTLKDQYSNNYTLLKSALNIPPSIDFAVTAKDYELTKNIPSEMSVIAKIYRMQVIDYNGSIETKDFTFKIW